MGNIAVIEKAEEQKLAALLGANDKPQSVDRLPQLKVNTMRKDAQGRKIEQGLFYLNGMDEHIYAQTVRIRPLSQLFQWINYDPEENKVVNKTLLIPNFRCEARDMKGGERCGKPTSKALKEMPKEEQKKYTNIKCFRQLRVLVSYKGADADGNEVTIENQPAILLLKGSNFNPFEDEFIKSIPRGRNFYDYWADVSAEELQNGSVIYYVMHFKPDLKKELSLDQPTYDSMKVMADMIERENNVVEKAYQKSLRDGQSYSDAIDAVSEVVGDDLSADLQDD
tara:strand:- start:10881 stop:11723 length:843 start_codon:yes stop_codon:yes gene_type:complete